MRLIVKLFLVCCLFCSLIFSKQVYKEIKINNPDSNIYEILHQNGVYIDHAHFLDGQYIIFVASLSDLQIIDGLGMNYEVLIEDLESFYQSRLTSNYTREFGLGSMGGYYTFDEIEQNLDELFNEYPQLVKEKISIGTTLEGRNIWAIKLSDNPNIEEDETKILYTGLHHSREPMSYMNLFYYMFWLCENYGIDDEATKILETRQLWFIPAINPDGLVYNQQIAPNGGGLQRKNMRQTCPSSPTGVDLNRNYSFQWGLDDQGSSGDGCNETYRGSSSFSEPETQAVRDFVDLHDFPIAFNYHSYSNLLIYPFGYSYENDAPAEDVETFIEYGEDMVQYNNYALGTGPELLYPVNGEACDWMYGEHGIFAYTPEIGSQSDGFWPATDRIVPLAEENLHPNKVLAINGGAVINSVAETSVGPYLQGEEYPINLYIENIGLSESRGNTTVSISSEQIDITIDDLEISSIDGRSNIDFGTIGYFEIPQNFESGSFISIEVNILNDSEFCNNSILTLQVGEPELVYEDSFDSNTNLDWYSSGVSDWYLTNQSSNSDSFSFRSGAIEDNQESSLFLDVEVPSVGTGQFSYRVSSEYSPSGSNFYDGLTFYVDDVELAQFQPNSDGESPWLNFYFDLDEGSHTLKWTYSKDGGGGSTDCDNTGCDDAAFIDDFNIFAFINYVIDQGDINLDTEVDILDIVLLVNFILDTQIPTQSQFDAADLNNDTILNVIDIVTLINVILEIE